MNLFELQLYNQESANTLERIAGQEFQHSVDNLIDQLITTHGTRGLLYLRDDGYFLPDYERITFEIRSIIDAGTNFALLSVDNSEGLDLNQIHPLWAGGDDLTNEGDNIGIDDEQRILAYSQVIYLYPDLVKNFLLSIIQFARYLELQFECSEDTSFRLIVSGLKRLLTTRFDDNKLLSKLDPRITIDVVEGDYVKDLDDYIYYKSKSILEDKFVADSDGKFMHGSDVLRWPDTTFCNEN